MRKIEFTAKFRRDFKRIKAGRYGRTLEGDIAALVAALANDLPLEPRFVDHPLGGDRAGFRDCHVHPDLVLIYKKTNENALVLTRLGSHSDLSL